MPVSSFNNKIKMNVLGFIFKLGMQLLIIGLNVLGCLILMDIQSRIIVTIFHIKKNENKID